MTVKTSISLTDQQAAFARKLVEEGRYASLSAVIQHGLDRLQMEREAEMAEIEALRAVLEARRKGPFVSNAEGKAQTAVMLARKRAELGLDG
jgi:antitoxin ParD1/3/4